MIGRRCHVVRALLISVIVPVCLASDGWAQPQVQQMAGVPLPSPDLPTGTVSVRVVKGSLRNNRANVAVELEVGGVLSTAKTDESGRAQFTGLAPGPSARASTVVDGERVVSQTFSIPPSGGVRLVLAAGIDSADAPPAVEAPRGTVVFGEQTRFVIEVTDGALDVYCLYQLLNAASTPVDPGAPLVFEAPPSAVGVTLLEGSTPQALLDGRTVTVRGPFSPGSTIVQIGYRMPVTDGTLTLEQQIPAALPETVVVVRKVGALDISSPQLSSRREVPVENRIYVMASGPGLGAGEVVRLTLRGVPTHPSWPRYLTLALASGIVLGGVVWSRTPRNGRPAEAHRQALLKRKNGLFGELMALERDHAGARLDEAAFSARRRALFARLERVLAELDEGGETSAERRSA